VVWGFDDYGADTSTVTADLVAGNVAQVFTNDYAFAIITTGGAVKTWGLAAYGGDSSSVAASLTSGVRSIYYNEWTFVAVKDDGSAVAW
jgi:hypothetical protein